MAARVKWPSLAWGVPAFVRGAVALPCAGDPEAFHIGGTTDEAAEELCGGCVHLVECREYGLLNRELSGVWGGLTERGRRRVRERRRRAAKVA